jgi:hypothetical protein
MMPNPITLTGPDLPHGRTPSTNDHQPNVLPRLLLQGPRRSALVPHDKVRRRTSVPGRKRRQDRRHETLAETATSNTITPTRRLHLTVILTESWKHPGMLLVEKRMNVAEKEIHTTSSQDDRRKSLPVLSTWKTGHITRCSHMRCLPEITSNAPEDVRDSTRTLHADHHHHHNAHRQKTRWSTSKEVRVAQQSWCVEDPEDPGLKVGNQRSCHAESHHVANHHAVIGNALAGQATITATSLAQPHHSTPPNLRLSKYTFQMHPVARILCKPMPKLKTTSGLHRCDVPIQCPIKTQGVNANQLESRRSHRV